MHPKVYQTIMRVINDKKNYWNGSDVQAYANQVTIRKQENEIKAWAIGESFEVTPIVATYHSKLHQLCLCKQSGCSSLSNLSRIFFDCCR